MSTGVNEPQTSTPAADALTGFRASLDQLVAAVEDGDLDHLDDLGLVGFLQGFELQRNRMALVDHRMLRDAEQRGLAGRLGQSRLSTVLTGALRISAGKAARRVRASAVVGDRVSMCGEPLAPVRPVLAAAQRTGQVSVEQVSIIERGLDRVDRRGFDPADINAAEVLLTGHALTFGPKDLKQLTEHTVESASTPTGPDPPMI